jgi:hypothetical protein
VPGLLTALATSNAVEKARDPGQELSTAWEGVRRRRASMFFFDVLCSSHKNALFSKAYAT